MSYSGPVQYDTSGTVRMGQGTPAVYNALVAAISQLLGYVGDQVLPIHGASISLLQSELRLKTMDAPLLDVAIHDFFGDTLPRLPNEANADYLNRALSILLQPKNTRPAIINMLTSLTGQPPHMINPDVPGDVGGLTATKDNTGGLVGGFMVFINGLYSGTTNALAPPTYLGVDVGGAPNRLANPNGRGTALTTIAGREGYPINPSGNNFGWGWSGFIDTTWPYNFGAQGNPVSGLMTRTDHSPPDEYGAIGGNNQSMGDTDPHSTGPYTTTISGTPITPSTMTIWLNNVAIGTDDGSGNLSGPGLAPGGTIDYSTGAISFTLAQLSATPEPLTVVYIGTATGQQVYLNIAGSGLCSASNPQLVNGREVYATTSGDPTCALFNPRGLTAADQQAGLDAVLSAINRLRPAGISIWARCLPAAYLAAEGFST
jgi:hypothetical protein